jgi:3-keto-L-gulonate-6-phosphate decarboxylase
VDRTALTVRHRGTSVDGAHIARVAAHRATRHRISLAGGIGPGNFAAVIAAAPDIAVIGSSVSAADDPEGTAAWLRQQLS